MILSLLLLAGLLPGEMPACPAAAPAPPPVLSVSAARKAGPGATVTVRAVVLNGAELGNIRYVQDADAGLALYALPTKVPGFSELQAGDSVQVTGTLKSYNGLLEMDPVASVVKLGADRPLRAKQVLLTEASEAWAEANESRLLEIKGVTHLTAPSGTKATSLSGNTNYLLNGQPGALVRVASSSTGPQGLVEAGVPTEQSFDVRGILSQYAPGGSGGYQLMPRMAADLVRGGGRPLITEEPVPVEVSSTSITVAFSTLNPGDTRVRYGLDTDNMRDELRDPKLTTRHRLTLENLVPGLTYYVEVSSRNAAGTETAAAVPFITDATGKKRRSGTKK